MLLLRYTLYCFIITFIKQEKTHSILTQRTLFVLNNSEILSYSNVSYILPPLWQVNLEKVLNCFQKLFQSCCIRRSSPSNCQKLYQPFDHTLPTPAPPSPPPLSHMKSIYSKSLSFPQFGPTPSKQDIIYQLVPSVTPYLWDQIY